MIGTQASRLRPGLSLDYLKSRRDDRPCGPGRRRDACVPTNPVSRGSPPFEGEGLGVGSVIQWKRENSLLYFAALAALREGVPWGVGRCSTLCQPTLHGVSAKTPCFVHRCSTPFFAQNYAPFVEEASCTDTFFVLRAEMPLCKSLIPNAHSI